MFRMFIMRRRIKSMELFPKLDFSICWYYMDVWPYELCLFITNEHVGDSVQVTLTVEEQP